MRNDFFNLWLLFHARSFDPLKFYLCPWHFIYYSFIKKFEKDAKNKFNFHDITGISIFFFSFFSLSFLKKKSSREPFKIRPVILWLYTVVKYCYRKINSCIIGRARFVPGCFPRLSQRELGQGDCRYFAWYVSSHPSTTILSKIDAVEILLLYLERRHRCSAHWNVVFQLLDFSSMIAKKLQMCFVFYRLN